MTPNEIKHRLGYFTGTEQWHRYSPLFPKILLTDGAKFVADQCGAYWLMDMIASYVPKLKKAGERFALARYAGTTGGSGLFSLTDDDPANTTYATQTVEFSDFPLDEIRFYVIDDTEHVTILLPSEY